MQNLRRGRERAREFERCFVEENKTRGIIFVRLTVLAVNSCAIEKFIAAHKENLHAAGALCARRFWPLGFAGCKKTTNELSSHSQATASPSTAKFDACRLITKEQIEAVDLLILYFCNVEKKRLKRKFSLR
jgi:hypothetical protein